MVERMQRHAMIHVEAELPDYLKSEFEQLMVELLAGKRSRMEVLERDVAAIEARATRALVAIVREIEEHPGTGQSGRLVRFLAGLYNGQDYSFDLTELRGLDLALANVCLDYLNYDRLAIAEVHRHLPNGEGQLHAWMQAYGLISGVEVVRALRT